MNNNITEIEKKWQKYWEENKVFEAEDNSDKEKYYYLVEFPYPSGSGLHVGHVRSYTALDVMARKKRRMGYNVLFPMGWDAFGAPAEQYAIKNKIHPSEAVKENIITFKGQIQKLGISFDWSREIATTDPEYYKWTQWQFLKFYEHGMAYKDKKNINWCPVCKTGLSNEDSSGGVCERCGSQVEQKEKEQWMLRMSSYAEDLISGLEDTKFQDKIKTAQINWIGKSTGAEIKFPLKEVDEKLTVYTTRPDTLYGVTFMVIAPEHPFINLYSGLISNMNEVIDYREKTNLKTEFERTQLVKDKTGIRINGLSAINPITMKEIPIYISDYVMMNYGTGAIMAVPAHDDRDYDFAKKYDIDIIQVLMEDEGIKKDNETEKEIAINIIRNPINNKYYVKDNKILETVVHTKDKYIEEIKEFDKTANIKLVSKGFKFAKHVHDSEKDKDYHYIYTPLLFEIDNFNNEEFVEIDDLNSLNLSETDKKAIELLFNPKALSGEGIHINSENLDNLNKEDAIKTIIDYIETKEIGNPKTNYKLQDWIFSRQRFWGEPIPLIHCDDCGWVPVKEEDLPVLLPNVANYEPTEDGESPLSAISEWVNVPCPKCGKMAKRETDTMPNWAGSSWYWLRYMDPKNDKEFVNFDKLKYWGKVDWYNGGMEHATRHLLYARFWNQFLYNIGLIPNKEPFEIRAAHGMILGEGGVKMSKSLGNVINPDDIVKVYGADAIRCYEMFIGDYEKEATWSEQGLKGCRRFLDRIIKIAEKMNDSEEYTKSLEILINQTIKKVTEDMDTSKFNTAVSALMILLNEYEKQPEITRKDFYTFISLLNPICPHITEELNEKYNLGEPLVYKKWPKYDENKIINKEKTIAVQVNGKVRGTINISIDDTDEIIKEKAFQEKNVLKTIEGKEIIKVIVINQKIVNIVVK